MDVQAPNIELPPACITGVGSLPFESWDTATKFSLNLCPELPFVPELPRAGKFSQMLLSPFVGLEEFFDEQSPPERAVVRKGELEPLLAALHEKLLAGHSPGRLALGSLLLEMKNIPGHAAAVKTQLVGPFTLFRCLSYGGRSLEHTEEAWHTFVDFLGFIIRKDALAVSQLGMKLLCVLDEPLLGSVVLREAGRTGTICRFYDRLSKVLHGVPVEIGIHCCGAFPVERAYELSDAISLRWISAPSSHLSTESWLKYLRAFLAGRGGLLLGVLPTEPGKQLPSLDGVHASIESFWKEVPVGRDEFLSRLVITPDCGLGLLNDNRAEETFELLKSVSDRLRGGEGR